MSSYVSAELRRLVRSRANGLCEYCLIDETDTFLGCQIDHIISEKHGGPTEPQNLAYACAFCNRAKGSDIGSIAQSTGAFTRFFDPRKDHWGDHFGLRKALIDPRTPIGEATSRILGFNEAERVLERNALQVMGRYPPGRALGATGRSDT
ncbi:MAG: HNH endonuclease signature motif containing protein [Planctomycetota bacterium]|jgi:hypothetical protein|nr:HNH endonuclease signature motif containing protein [Planctomycetota bacterium]MDP7251658.1 HNH endonuclease signature motif containing protein [Planctomycetota bacterium]